MMRSFLALLVLPSLSACTYYIQTAAPSEVIPPSPSLQVASAASGAALRSELGNFRCPVAGVVIKTSTGNSLESEGASGNSCKFMGNRGEFSQYAGFSAGNANAKVHNAAAAIWPLKVGNKSSAQFDSENVASDNILYWQEFKVAAFEPVTVRAGTFQAFRIESEQSNIKANGYHDKGTYWWSPDVGYIVKYTFEVLKGHNSNANQNWEAVIIEQPK
jgi:hypothetical protein